MSAQITWKEVLFCSGDFRTKCLKILDYYVGGLLCILFRPRSVPRPQFQKESISKILIIRPGGIGDAVFLIPFIKELKNIFTAAQLDVLVEKRNADVFFLIRSLVNEIFFYDRVSLFSLCKRLREKKYDIVFDTEQWHNLTALLSYSIGKKIRVGFDTRPNRSKFYTFPVHYSNKDYEIESFLHLLNALLPIKIMNYRDRVFLEIPHELLCWAKSMVYEKDKIVALCLSASIKERFWSIKNFQDITQYLIKKGYTILFLGGKKERESYCAIAGGVPQSGDILDYVGKINILETAALLSVSQFYIGLDSGILHIACALGKPTISLFGPGNKDKWAPSGSKHIVISSNAPCAPCTWFGYTLHCDSMKCMKDIRAQEVISAVDTLEKVI